MANGNIPKKIFDKACDLAIMNHIRMDDFKKDVKEDINGLGTKVEKIDKRMWYVITGLVFVFIEGLIILIK